MNTEISYVLKLNDTGSEDLYLKEDLTDRIGTRTFISTSLLTTKLNAYKFTDITRASKVLEQLNTMKLVDGMKKDNTAPLMSWALLEVSTVTDVKEINTKAIQDAEHQRIIDINNDKIRELREENVRLRKFINTNNPDTRTNIDNMRKSLNESVTPAIQSLKDQSGFFSREELDNLFGKSKETRKLRSDDNSFKDAPELELNVSTFADLLKFAAHTFNTK